MNKDSLRRFANMWVTLLVVWLIANASLAVDVVLSGMLISAAVAFPLLPFGSAWTDIRWSPRAVVHLVGYLGVFLQELVKANLNVAGIVFSRRIAINPGIVEIRTRLKSPIGRLVLANSITLTPGTLVVDVRGDSLFIHWISVAAQDPQAATEEIAGRFERYLEVIYG